MTNMQNIDIEQASKLLEQHSQTTNSGAFKHISYEVKMNKSLTELMWTDPTKVIKFGTGAWEVWNKKLGGIYWWKIYAIGWESGLGKSTFVNQLANSLSKQWVKVTKYSLEDRMEDIGKEDLYVYANRERFKMWLPSWDFPKFMNNEYFHPNGTDYEPSNIDFVNKALAKLNSDNKNITELDKYKQVSIEDMVRLMEEEAQAGTKVFIIDHLHYFKKTSQTRTDLEIEEIMHDINEIARKYNVAVFLLAHYRKLNNSDPTNDAFKDWAAIKQVANIIIHLSRDWELTRFTFGKIRWKIKCKGFFGNYDVATDSYRGFTEIID